MNAYVDYWIAIRKREEKKIVEAKRREGEMNEIVDTV